MSEEQFELVEPFDIDNGELGGVSAEFAFSLGVEWANFRATLLDTPGRFEATVHHANADRLIRMCKRHRRAAAVRGTDGDWVKIEVEPEVLN